MDLVQFAAVPCGRRETRERGIGRLRRGGVVRVGELQSMGWVSLPP
jgi:hypothetical protein